MITFKKIDLYGQALIFGFGILLLFADKDRWIIMSLLFSLPIGCWQVLSILVHLSFKNKLVILKERTGYICSVFGFFIILPLYAQSLADEATMFLYFFIASTSLAIWYFTISFRELKIWEFRRFIQLK